MTESEWLSSTNTRSLLEYIVQMSPGRKHWLFACACCRSVWHLLSNAAQEFVEDVERSADGQGTVADLIVRFQGSDPYQHFRPLPIVGGNQAAEAVRSLSWPLLSCSSSTGICEVKGFPFFVGSVSLSSAEALAKTVSWAEARNPQADLIRDVFGNPFRTAAISPSWQKWNDGTVVKIAQVIYEERAFDRLPILADALEEAGCGDERMLDHGRVLRTHVRGCWLVDGLLGKA